MNTVDVAAVADELATLVDGFGRRHESLRISVTDRCNLRCTYCMPVEGLQFLPRSELLTFEEIAKFVRAIAPLGVRKLRLTGGEPLVRHDLPALVRLLAAVPGVEDLALTTNGLLLAEQAVALRAAGLQRLNVSLDAVSREGFEQIARRPGLDRVLAGLAAAQSAGFDNIRLNAVALRGFSENEAIPLAEFALEHDLELRFIEFMPLDAEQHWTDADVLTGHRLRAIIEARFGALEPRDRPTPSQPATDYWYADRRGRLGLINPVSEPFCGACDRLRLTAEGQVRNCLFSTREWDARAVLRSGGDAVELRRLVRSAIAAKAVAHGIGQGGFQRPERAMYQIGG